MAKDDYNYLVFKILTYLYACLRRRCCIESAAFLKKIITPEVQEDYLVDVLRFMAREGLIEGLAFVKVWGNDYVLANNYADMCITPQGIRYLLDNDTMQQVKKAILEGAPGIVLDLVKLAL